MRCRDTVEHQISARLLGVVLTLFIGAAAASAQPPAAPTDSGDSSGGSSTNPATLRLLGYSDASFSGEWPEKGRATSSFGIGQFDLLFTSTLGRDWSALAEVVVEVDQNNEFAIDLERAVVTYAPRDAFNLSVGRFHSVISYYNATYPHAAWYQVAANRPLSQAFEDQGGLLPSHGVGVSVSGRSGGPLRPRYVFELTNGVGTVGIGTPSASASVQNLTDQNNDKAVVGALQIRPVTLPGWQFGVAALVDRIGPEVALEVDQRAFSGHAVYQGDTWEWITEAYSIRHQPASGGTATSSGAYTQLAWQVAQARPFFRYEQLQVSAGDPLHLNAAGTTRGPSVGVRFDPSRFVGIKTQFDWLHSDVNQGRKRLVVQFSFAF